MENVEKFSGRAAVYAEARPGYAEGLYRYLSDTWHLDEHATIADIGSGTGKFAEPLLRQGYSVLCVEPNADMRLQAEALLGGYAGFSSVEGSAESTTLANGSASYVTVAQAFHWFDPSAFRRECVRILEPGGEAALIWNFRNPESDLVKENAEICKAFCPHFTGFSGGADLDLGDIEEFFGGIYRIAEFPNDLCFTEDRFLKRMLSASYAPRPDDEWAEPYLAALSAMFRRHARQGILTLPNTTTAYLGAPA